MLNRRHPLLQGRSATQGPTIPVWEPRHPTWIFVIYLVFQVFTFLNLPNRVAAIGVLRPTLVLTAIIFASLVLTRPKSSPTTESELPWRMLIALIWYSLLVLPFVEWPGSVLGNNFAQFAKVAVLLFFTPLLADTLPRLRWFVLVVIGLQTIRVIEPYYLHLTDGYWGDRAFIGGDETWFQRLAGAPPDVVNANGLAFVVLCAFPFVHYLLLSARRWWATIAWVVLLGIFLHVIILTGSRSGAVGLIVSFIVIVWASKRKVLLIPIIALAAVLAFSFASPEGQDRFSSLWSSSNTKHTETRDGRLNAIVEDFKLGLERPIFGHGLGTSQEANWQKKRNRHISHTLYAEALIEFGATGFAIFCAFLWGIIREIVRTFGLLREDSVDRDEQYLRSLAYALNAWVWSALIFSIAQYGVSEWHWYLMGGIVISVSRIVRRRQDLVPPIRSPARN